MARVAAPSAGHALRKGSGKESLGHVQWNGRLPMAVIENESNRTTQSTQSGRSRRRFLFKLGAALNLLAAALISIPVIGYLLSSFRRTARPDAWIELGSVETFPENQTRLATFRNPYSRPWDGMTAD